jgi:ribose transport system substrate-binding protein
VPTRLKLSTPPRRQKMPAVATLLRSHAHYATFSVVAAAALTVLTACGSSGNSSAGRSGASTASSTAATSSTTCSPTAATSSDPAIAAAQKIVAKAAGATTAWDGPTTGPTAFKNASIVFVANTMSNPGDAGVYAGLKQAAAALGWKIKGIDGGSTPANNLAALNQALALHPNAIAVSSIDPHNASAFFQAAKSAGIPVIGNHAGNNPGPDTADGLFTNITSDPVAISQAAAACAIVASNGKAGVTITGCGSEAAICSAKEDAMQTELKTCSGCKVLATDNFPYEDLNQREGGIAAADLQKYGKSLTYMLAINDGYFDSAIPSLRAAGATQSGPPLMIAAGDGSPAAFARIRTGQYQIATVAEPLNEHGWQMADEINRALNHQAPSTYVTYPHLVTIANTNTEGGTNNTFDPANGYQTQYEKIWGK